MESLSRGYVAADGTTKRPMARRLATACLMIAGLVVLAAAPAEAGHKHKHKHGHGHGHGHGHYERHYHHYDYDDGYDDDGNVVVIVNPRPRYVAPPVVHHYYPQPVYGRPLFSVVIPVEID